MTNGTGLHDSIMSDPVDEKRASVHESIDEKGPTVDIFEKVILEDEVYKHDQDEGVDHAYELKSAMGMPISLSRVIPFVVSVF